jgi:hypothetical protein
VQGLGGRTSVNVGKTRASSIALLTFLVVSRITYLIAPRELLRHRGLFYWWIL